MVDSETGNGVVYNGEIYNYRSLREELAEGNTEWRSNSDTEVLLKSYGRLGVDCLRRFRGMFAFALWDTRRRTLLLARDPFGIKPLYYYQEDGTFVFASEIRAVLASGLVSRQLSQKGLISYLRYGSVEAPHTMIEGVRSVRPGHYLTVEVQDGRLQVSEISYATKLLALDDSLSTPAYKEATAQLRELLEESVCQHLVSDVPLGVFLSGGIDSSVIVALMSRVAKEPPKTFSVVFAEQQFSEAVYARLVAKKFHTDHHEIPLSETALLSALPASLEAMDQPTMDGINTFVISRVVKEAGATVALSGLGGDELFAGYPSFRRVKQLQGLRNIPPFLRKAITLVGRMALSPSVRNRKLWALLEGGGNPWSVYSTSRQLFAPVEIESLVTDAPRGTGELEHQNDADPINAVSIYELSKYMANTLLRDTDFMSMAHALEVRVPFVDSVVAPFVLQLPGEWKLDGRRPKPLLLDTLGDLLPQEIWQRPKMGFTLPFERWMLSGLQPELEKVLSRQEGLRRWGLNIQGIQDVWQAFKKSPRRERWSRPWALYVLKKWCQLNEVEG